MIEKYKELNDDAKRNLLMELENITNDGKVLERCKREIDIMYNKGNLFIIEYLSIFKKDNPSVNYCFNGLENNLLLLYMLGLSNVNPVKHNLSYEPYEISSSSTLNLSIINLPPQDFINTVHVCNCGNFRFFKGSFKKSEDEKMNEKVDNHYLIIPSHSSPYNMTFKYDESNRSEIDILSTVEDYREFEDEYLTIRLDDKKFIFEKDVDIKNALHTEFEEEVSKQLKPKTVDDYVKVISLAHGTRVWKENQDELFKEGKIDIHSVISNREDVYEYLIQHSIKHDIAIDIVKQMSKARTSSSNELWQKYVDIMKEHNCDEMFIGIISKVLYIFGRGQAVSECLYELDETNYYTG